MFFTARAYTYFEMFQTFLCLDNGILMVEGPIDIFWVE